MLTSGMHQVVLQLHVHDLLQSVLEHEGGPHSDKLPGRALQSHLKQDAALWQVQVL